jgi:hypothetical protein
MILGDEKWHSLFSTKDLEICAARLAEYGYRPA